jgi:hypothetical protein
MNVSRTIVSPPSSCLSSVLTFDLLTALPCIEQTWSSPSGRCWQRRMRSTTSEWAMHYLLTQCRAAGVREPTDSCCRGAHAWQR